MKFPDVSKPETLEKRYLNKMSGQEIDLMKGLLNMNPRVRLQASDALMHPYFDDIREQYVFDLLNNKVRMNSPSTN